MTSHGETIMRTWDDKDQHVKLLEKLQTKHDELFEHNQSYLCVLLLSKLRTLRVHIHKDNILDTYFLFSQMIFLSFNQMV